MDRWSRGKYIQTFLCIMLQIIHDKTQFSLHAISLSRHMAMCTALVCRVQCSTPAKPPASAAKWQICNVRPQDIVTTRSNELLARLGIEDLDLILKKRMLRWYGHVEHSSRAIKTAFHIQVERKCGPGRPKMTWKQLTERDCRVEALGYQPSW